MAWEKRGNCSYLYHKKRIGNKVKTIYVGSGGDIALIELIENLRQQKEEDERERRKWERTREQSAQMVIDEQIDELVAINRALVDALFLIYGYHRHKGQWRKKRT